MGETIDLKIEVAVRLWLGAIGGGAVIVDTGAIAGAISVGEVIKKVWVAVL